MAVAGTLRDIGIPDLIQNNCLDRKKAKLTIKHKDRQAELYFNKGSVVHAAMGKVSGEAVVMEILHWEDGTFVLDKNVDAPKQTIQRTWAALLLEGAHLIDEANYQTNEKGKVKKMNAKLFPKVVETLKDDLGDGLVATDVFTAADGQSLAGHNSNPQACALFNEITRYLHKSLKGSGFPGLGGYYLVHLENNMAVVVITRGEIQNGMLIDLSKTTMGLLLNVALPKIINLIDEAIKG